MLFLKQLSISCQNALLNKLEYVFLSKVATDSFESRTTQTSYFYTVAYVNYTAQKMCSTPTNFLLKRTVVGITKWLKVTVLEFSENLLVFPKCDKWAIFVPKINIYELFTESIH